MKLFLVILFLASPASAAGGNDVKIGWSLPASYTDGTPIDRGDVQKILVMVYTGPAKTGPWKWVATSPPGATSIAVIGPSAGQTCWYTVKSSLNGAESEYAIPVIKNNDGLSISVFAEKAFEKMFTKKKMLFLLFLLVLVGSIWLIWYLRKEVRK
jgi:hypothetical protein